MMLFHHARFINGIKTETWHSTNTTLLFHHARFINGMKTVTFSASGCARRFPLARLRKRLLGTSKNRPDAGMMLPVSGA